MQLPTDIAARFRAIDAHDDTAEGFVIHPANGKRKATVEVTLFRHWKNQRRLLVLKDCANVEVSMDADVLQDNAPNNTAVLEATASVQEIRSLMRSHKRAWNVRYERGLNPLPAKLSNADEYVLFRVRLFGGALRVIARSFKVGRLTAACRPTRARAARAGGAGR